MFEISVNAAAPFQKNDIPVIIKRSWVYIILKWSLVSTVVVEIFEMLAPSHADKSTTNTSGKPIRYTDQPNHTK